jgi:hypothetical protein
MWRRRVLGLLSMVALACKGASPERPATPHNKLTRADLRDAWPFKVDEVELGCRDLGLRTSTGDGLPALYFVAGGVTYALNGTAKSHADKQGWQADFRALWRDDPANPGAKVSVGPLLERARQLCGK